MKLEIDGVYHEIKGKTILSDIYLSIEIGETVGILGRNGSGKSTLFDLIFSIKKSGSFSMRIDGVNKKNVFKNQLVQYLPQDGFLLPSLSIHAAFKYMHVSYSQMLGLQGCTPNMKVRELSFGQKRILEISLILKSKSKFVFLDEPFSGLSPIGIETVKEQIKAIDKSKGIVITDHLYGDILDVSDRLLLIDSGALKPILKSADALALAGYISASPL